MQRDSLEDTPTSVISGEMQFVYVARRLMLLPAKHLAQKAAKESSRVSLFTHRTVLTSKTD